MTKHAPPDQTKYCPVCLNQNTLPVICQIDNYSSGAVTGGKLDPSSHKRTSTHNHPIFQQRIREVTPVPDGLRKETTFICLYTSRGYLKCHGMLIYAMPSFGNKVICRYSCFTFQTFV